MGLGDVKTANQTAENKDKKKGNLKGMKENNSPRLVLKSGEQVEVVYDGYEVIDDPFEEGSGRKVAKYFFIKGTQRKELTSGAGYLVDIFENIDVGQKLIVTRQGEGKQTRYAVVTI